MRRTVVDMMEVRAAMDEEDRELMGMFSQKRKAATNDLLLVMDGERLYLVSKQELARKKKQMQDLFDLGLGMAAAAALAGLLAAASSGAVEVQRAMPWMGIVPCWYGAVSQGIRAVRRNRGRK